MDLVEKHYDSVMSNNPDANDEIFSADVATTFPGVGTLHSLEAFKEVVRGFAGAFPDGRFTFTSSVESGNRIAVQGIYSGTNTGPLLTPAGEMPPTGRRLELPYGDFFEVENGKIVRHNLYFDQVVFMTQLGLMPAPDQVGA
jgi:predicted ester cyclase